MPGRRTIRRPALLPETIMSSIERNSIADLVERLARLKERLTDQGRHREADVVARAIAEEAAPVRTRGDVR